MKYEKTAFPKYLPFCNVLICVLDLVTLQRTENIVNAVVWCVFLYVKRSMQCPLLQIAIYINFSSRFILLLLIWLIIMTCYSVLQYAKKSSCLAFSILQRVCFIVMCRTPFYRTSNELKHCFFEHWMN